jgi:hypothetical protein
MSGHPSLCRRHGARRARSRLALMGRRARSVPLTLIGLVGWAFLMVASVAAHSRDGVGSARLATPAAQGGATAAVD